MHDSFVSDKKFSIIIPSLNEEKLIKQVVSQFNDGLRRKYELEIIVSDGGSTDKTLSLIEGIADKVVTKNNKGGQNISLGRNAGAENSRGDVLVFLNADTLLKDAGSFFGRIEEIFADEKVLAIACPIFVFPEEQRMSDKLFHFFYNNYVKLLNIFFMGMGRGECHIVRRKTFFDLNGYDANLAAGEDFDLYKRLRKNGKIKFCRDLVVYESPRRYRKYGYAKVFWDWVRNSVWVTIFKRSVSNEWEAVR